MNTAPKTRNRLGLTPFEWKPSNQYVRSVGPFHTYREHEPDLVQLFENDCRLMWKECAPFDIPKQYEGLKATAHDELWENQPDNDVGSRTIREKGSGVYRDVAVPVKPKPQKQEIRKNLSEVEKAIMRKFYPWEKFE